MPVVNRRAIEQAMLVGLALNCDINAFTSFARKNYFYPDLPKGYQISQFDFPLATGGWIEVETAAGERVRVGIRRAHMEEDTAKSDHTSAAGPDQEAITRIDFNRSGVPLLEIVSDPDMRSVAAAQAYAVAIREILRYLGVNSGDMEKGALRFEANVSVRPRGSDRLGTRTEIKNLNSFRALAGAIEVEIGRQIALLEAGGTVVQETRGWNESRRTTFPQRSKEVAHDYRYFPEPDLPPLTIDRAWVEEVRATLPELPQAKRIRFVADYGLSADDTSILTAERTLADYFEVAVAAYDRKPGAIGNWIVGPLTYLMNREGVAIDDVRVAPQALARLVELVDQGTINQQSAKEVLEEMFATGRAPGEIVEARGLVQISDEEALAQVVDQVMAENTSQVESYREGKTAVLQWFMGQVMRVTRGRAEPQTVLRLLEERLRRS
jgi:aspartyl-tRNA(Asn)/glutamyl-tRNA(Gln) amidotransferase subunit B